jgi:hypothetical protein
MRIANILGALAGLAAAIPYPQDDSSGDPDTITLPFPTPTIPVVATTSLNIPVTLSLDIPIATRSKKPHWEPIPIFTKECKCNVATVRYPCWATDALQVSTCWAVVDTQSMEIPRKDWLCMSIYTCSTDTNVTCSQKCNYEENFSYGCYMEAAGGCPTPTRVVSLPSLCITKAMYSRQLV